MTTTHETQQTSPSVHNLSHGNHEGVSGATKLSQTGLLSFTRYKRVHNSNKNNSDCPFAYLGRDILISWSRDCGQDKTKLIP